MAWHRKAETEVTNPSEAARQSWWTLCWKLTLQLCDKVKRNAWRHSDMGRSDIKNTLLNTDIWALKTTGVTGAAGGQAVFFEGVIIRPC